MSDRALLIRLGGIGDTLHASAAARALADRFPGMKVDFLASPVSAGLFPMIPEVDRVFLLGSRRAPFRFNPAWRRLRRELGREEYRLVCLLETDPRFLPLMEGVRADRRVFLGRDERISGEEAARLAVPVRYHRLLRDLGLARDRALPPRLVPGAHARERAAELVGSLGLDLDPPIVGLHPGNSFRARKRFRRWLRKGDLRSWPEERWSGLIAGLHRARPGAQVVLFGAPADRAVNRRVAREARNLAPAIRIADAAGRTDLPLAAALLERCSLFVSTDTGPLHMAAALGVPLIGLYGPTRHEQTCPVPVRPSSALVIRGTLPCQPCYGTPLQKTCRENQCMRSIQVEDVLRQAEAVSSSRLN